MKFAGRVLQFNIKGFLARGILPFEIRASSSSPR